MKTLLGLLLTLFSSRFVELHPPIQSSKPAATLILGRALGHFIFSLIGLKRTFFTQRSKAPPSNSNDSHQPSSKVPKQEPFDLQAQSLQNPLIKEYTLNHIRDPIII